MLVSANLAALFLMRGVQEWEARTGRISPRRPFNAGNRAAGFLYLQDYYTTMYGDYVGLSAMVFGVAWLAQDQFPSIFVVIGCLIFALAFTAGSHLAWLGPRHSPDAGYPETGKVSWMGRVHLVYFCFQLTLAPLGIWMVGTMIEGSHPWSLAAAVGLAGGLFYVLMWIVDIKQADSSIYPDFSLPPSNKVVLPTELTGRRLSPTLSRQDRSLVQSRVFELKQPMEHSPIGQ